MSSYRNPDGTFKKGVKRPETNSGRKGFYLEEEQYKKIKEIVYEYIKLAKKLFKGKVEGTKKIKKDSLPKLLEDWMKDRSHSGLYLHKNKKGYEYHFNPELQAFLAEKLEIGKKMIDKVHPQKSAEKVTFEYEKIEEGLDIIKEALGKEVKVKDEF